MESRETLRDGMTLYVSDVDSLTDFKVVLSDIEQSIRTHVSGCGHTIQRLMIVVRVMFHSRAIKKNSIYKILVTK